MAFDFHLYLSSWRSLAAIVTGLGVAAKAAWSAYKHYLSEEWDVVTGVCTLAQVEKQDNVCRLRLLYSYRAQGQKFADAGEYCKTFPDELMALNWANALREAEIPVRHNPGKPSQSDLWDSDLAAIVTKRVYSP